MKFISWCNNSMDFFPHTKLCTSRINFLTIYQVPHSKTNSKGKVNQTVWIEFKIERLFLLWVQIGWITINFKLTLTVYSMNSIYLCLLSFLQAFAIQCWASRVYRGVNGSKPYLHFLGNADSTLWVCNRWCHWPSRKWPQELCLWHSVVSQGLQY